MTEKQAIEWVKDNIPIAIKPTKQAKTKFVSVFKTNHAFDVATEHLGKELYKLLK